MNSTLERPQQHNNSNSNSNTSANTRTHTVTRLPKQLTKVAPPVVGPPLTPGQELRKFSSEEVTVGIYVVGQESQTPTQPSGPGPALAQSQSQSPAQPQSHPQSQKPDEMAGISSAGGVSQPATLERGQVGRLSWINIRRRGEGHMAMEAATLERSSTITPSPQTTRSFVSTVITNGGGTVSGRNTAASGCMSTSGVATISGSNNTLNDIMSDYHVDANSTGGYHYRDVSAAQQNNYSSNGSFNITNGSTVKLLSPAEEETNSQTKCSVFRGLALCVCLNISYANIVRFPRELDRYGSAYLVPYCILLFLVGLPIILLEVTVGQFLGQGAVHTWRASPIFKGACIISRFASWLATIWMSLQAVLAAVYIGMLIFNGLPFRECIGNIKLALNGYTVTTHSGQDCLERTFLNPFWENPLYFGLMAIGLIVLWTILMLSTHNGKTLRRSIFVFGLIGFPLVCCLTGWEVHNSLVREYFPDLWIFDSLLLQDSNIWFNALIQVLFATNCGLGILPVITGKFLYKGDAVRTSVVFLCFNMLINALAVTLFLVQFDLSAKGHNSINELRPFTAVYDRFLYVKPDNELVASVLPILIYGLILLACIISICTAIYTATRLVPRHPNYVVSLVALIMSVIALAAPKFMIGRILDTRIVGTLLITALIFELIAITWIYGAKNIYTDLEFSIGRPIFKGWMVLWCTCPAVLTGILVWWCSDDDQYDLLAEYVPRWAPILFALAIIFVIACVQIFRQVDYNFFGMICEASKPAKEWGPADPLARHAWKQWRSVCQDTGRRDFTLRRRGTRDYTHSIKKGQYSTASRYISGQQQQANWKSSTPGNSSPNYSGSMFGDSAIEEDISIDKFPGITQQYVPFQAPDGKPLRFSNRSRVQQRSTASLQQQVIQPQQPPPQQHQQHQQHQHQHQQQQRSHHQQPQQQHQQQLQKPLSQQANSQVERHREVVYIRRLSDDGQHATRIEITPSNECITYGNGSRNPLARAKSSLEHSTTSLVSGSSNHLQRLSSGGSHIQSLSNSQSTSSSNSQSHIPSPSQSQSHSQSQTLSQSSSQGNGITEGLGNRNSMVSVSSGKLPTTTNPTGSGEHICWRKFNIKSQQFSTEL